MDPNVLGPSAAERTRHILIAGLCLGLLAMQADKVHAQQSAVHGEWRSYGGDGASTKYSPLAQIDRDNVSRLRVLWRRPGVDPKLTETYPDLNPSNDFRATPLMLGGVLYSSNSVGLVEAIDPGTGETLWIQEPLQEGFQGMAGRSTRGVAHWSSGSSQRVFSVRGDYLVSMSAETGSLDRDFGDGGKVDLRRNGPAPLPAGGSAGPIVVGGVVIVAGAGGDDFPILREGPAEDIRGYDVRTGRLRWTFHVRPQPGEFGFETWEGDSWKLAGSMGGWAPLTVDDELGYIYVALSSPMHSFYGGHRPGQNLYGNSLVCLDARTGERVWHYQLVHHDLWDYDLPAAPVLGDITVAGKPIKAVMQITKHGFLFVFDRVTGEPVWPIEERPVPASTTPGEKAWPTQPFPTKPAPFDRLGAYRRRSDRFHAGAACGGARDRQAVRARADVHAAVGGGSGTYPGYAHASLGTAGGGNWNGGAFDPETGIFYVASHTHPWLSDLVRPPARCSKRRRRTCTGQRGHRSARATGADLQFRNLWSGRPSARQAALWPHHCDRSEQRRAPMDGPQWRRAAQSPALATPEPAPAWDSRAGRRLFSRRRCSSSVRASPIIVFDASKGGGGNKFRAYDKATGRCPVGDRAGGRALPERR